MPRKTKRTRITTEQSIQIREWLQTHAHVLEGQTWDEIHRRIMRELGFSFTRSTLIRAIKLLGLQRGQGSHVGRRSNLKTPSNYKAPQSNLIPQAPQPSLELLEAQRRNHNLHTVIDFLLARLAR